MVRGRSVSKKAAASTMNTGCGTSNALQSHSKYPNDCGQPSQNGNDAQMETNSQTTDKKPNKRALGRPTVCRVIQPPPSTMSDCDFMAMLSIGLTLRLTDTVPMMSDCQPRRGSGVRRSRFVGMLLGHHPIPRSFMKSAFSRYCPSRSPSCSITNFLTKVAT